MFMNNAASRFMTSAFGLTDFKLIARDDDVCFSRVSLSRARARVRQEVRRHSGVDRIAVQWSFDEVDCARCDVGRAR